MGIKELWNILKGYNTTKRLPFSVFVTQYRKKNGRAPRIAIDAFQWLFECGVFSNSDQGDRCTSPVRNISRKAVLNFVTKLKDLMALDVEFVLVFDGLEKPVFKSHSRTKTGKQLDRDERGRSPNRFPRQLDPLIEEILEVCDSFRVDYIIARGEGEALCAWLQSNGVVDYVLSNDSDSIVFGAKKVLRNFSKHFQDLPSSGTSPMKKHVTEYFVSLIDVDELRARHPTVNEKSFLLFTILIGADYSSGIRHLGYKRAWAITQWSNGRLCEEFGNFCSHINDPVVVVDERYDAFKRSMIEACRNNSKAIFGQNIQMFSRKDAINLFNWPTVEHVKSYYEPKVLAKDFKHTLFRNTNSASGSAQPMIAARELLDRMGVSSIVKDFDQWTHTLLHSCVLLKELLHGHNNTEETMKITEDKVLKLYEAFTIELWKVRFKSFLPYLSEPDKTSTDSPVGRSPSRRQLDIIEYPYAQWLPKGLIPETHSLVLSFREEQEYLSRTAKSPSKKKTPKRQLSTLDRFLDLPESPIKRRNISQQPPVKITPIALNDTSSSEDDSSLTILDSAPPSFPSLSPLKRPLTQDNMGAKVPTEKQDNVLLELADLEEPARIQRWYLLHFKYSPNNTLDQKAIWDLYLRFLTTTLGIQNNTIEFHDLPHLLDGILPDVTISFSRKRKNGYTFKNIKEIKPAPNSDISIHKACRRLLFHETNFEPPKESDLPGVRPQESQISNPARSASSNKTLQPSSTSKIDAESSLEILN
ncbi:HHL084Cp [Eremothecium sinecaudum]|uniref:HHL084Cp n=1 Tax=Eremothecium sinecaudum TaxID=45286 RepID=A0A0X8HWA8_9SACH|nr:HHL084Cp [Eremothecium sinecaudum]AMD22686.1 HHL084Cp [Eremothecium sinecaudum]